MRSGCLPFTNRCTCIFFSDTMGNQGAFINIKGNDLTPKFTSYKAVVSTAAIVNCLHSTLTSNRIISAAPSEREADGVRQLADESDDVIKMKRMRGTRQTDVVRGLQQHIYTHTRACTHAADAGFAVIFIHTQTQEYTTTPHPQVTNFIIHKHGIPSNPRNTHTHTLSHTAPTHLVIIQ